MGRADGVPAGVDGAAGGIREVRNGNAIYRSAEGPAAFDLLASMAGPPSDEPTVMEASGG